MKRELDPRHQEVAAEAQQRIARLIGSAMVSEVEQPIPEIEEQL